MKGKFYLPNLTLRQVAQPFGSVHQQDPDQQERGKEDFRLAQKAGKQVGGHRKRITGPLRQLHQELLLLHPSQAPTPHKQEFTQRPSL